MKCELCAYYGGFIKSSTSYSGLHMVCNAPKEHLEKKRWCYVEGATLPGRHCGVLKCK